MSLQWIILYRHDIKKFRAAFKKATLILRLISIHSRSRSYRRSRMSLLSLNCCRSSRREGRR